MADLAPFRFEWGDGPIHRLHPLSKLIALLLLSWAALAARPHSLLPLAAVAIAILALLRAGAGEVARNARFLVPLSLFVAFVNVFEPEGAPWFRPAGIVVAALYMARLGLVFLFAEAFFRSTSTGELADAATRLGRRLPGAYGTDPGFYLSLALGFIPRSIEAYERCREAALARGLGLRRGGLGGLRAKLLVLESFVAASLRAALRSAAALEARSYNPGRSVAPRPPRPVDILLPLLAAAAAVAGARY